MGREQTCFVVILASLVLPFGLLYPLESCSFSFFPFDSFLVESREREKKTRLSSHGNEPHWPPGWMDGLNSSLIVVVHDESGVERVLEHNRTRCAVSVDTACVSGETVLCQWTGVDTYKSEGCIETGTVCLLHVGNRRWRCPVQDIECTPILLVFPANWVGIQMHVWLVEATSRLLDTHRWLVVCRYREKTAWMMNRTTRADSLRHCFVRMIACCVMAVSRKVRVDALSGVGVVVAYRQACCTEGRLSAIPIETLKVLVASSCQM